MTFQIVSLSMPFYLKTKTSLLRRAWQNMQFWGVGIGVLIFVYNKELQELFHTKTATMFVIFSFGIPLYFLMSINRGLYQGQNVMDKLAFTKPKWLVWLLLTIAAVLLLPDFPPSIIARELLYHLFLVFILSENIVPDFKIKRSWFQMKIWLTTKGF
jgi:hypothetical protein